MDSVRKLMFIGDSRIYFALPPSPFLFSSLMAIDYSKEVIAFVILSAGGASKTSGVVWRHVKSLGVLVRRHTTSLKICSRRRLVSSPRTNSGEPAHRRVSGVSPRQKTTGRGLGFWRGERVLWRGETPETPPRGQTGGQKLGHRRWRFSPGEKIVRTVEILTRLSRGARPGGQFAPRRLTAVCAVSRLDAVCARRPDQPPSSRTRVLEQIDPQRTRVLRRTRRSFSGVVGPNRASDVLKICYGFKTNPRICVLGGWTREHVVVSP